VAGDGRSRRRFRRTTLRIEVEYESEGETRRDVATTLGAGGLFIATEDPLDEGSALMARFRLPQQETLHEIAGRVVWSHRKGDLPPQTSGMGICFADPAAGAVLAAEIEAMLSEREKREPSSR
jgi:uncharacterized protein (TIGR02266 family)